MTPVAVEIVGRAETLGDCRNAEAEVGDGRRVGLENLEEGGEAGDPEEPERRDALIVIAPCGVGACTVDPEAGHLDSNQEGAADGIKATKERFRSICSPSPASTRCQELCSRSYGWPYLSNQGGSRTSVAHTTDQLESPPETSLTLSSFRVIGRLTSWDTITRYGRRIGRPTQQAQAP